jgi:hypothetical protein
MKKPYQIESQRAVKQLEQMAEDGNPAVQMVLPMAEMVGWLRKGVGELIRQAGLQLIGLLMEEEVRELVGERNRPNSERRGPSTFTGCSAAATLERANSGPLRLQPRPDRLTSWFLYRTSRRVRSNLWSPRASCRRQRTSA